LAAFFEAGFLTDFLTADFALALPLAFAFAGVFFAGRFLFFAIEFLLSHQLDV
jgi:hypothetical protein